MKNVLVVTTDLPFFPGKNGHDFFNLRYLALTDHVCVVAPKYDTCPPKSVDNLAVAIQELRTWPDLPGAVRSFVKNPAPSKPAFWIKFLPQPARWRILRRMLGISSQPADSLEGLAVLANCAPHLLEALQSRHWHAIVLIQSTLAPWLEFLPNAGSKIVYFHDVRSDYLARSINPPSQGALSAILHQETRAAAVADAVGFVSKLDLERARKKFTLPQTCLVAPIPVDTDYFTPRPGDWAKTPVKTVLFTGHLRHPPNVDAVLYFVNSVWPLIMLEMPEARFQAVGLTPHPEIVEAIARTPQAELHSNVPDIRPYFWDADVYVVPMRYGGGVRQKIFEAWSMRTPLVSTTMGAEGTGAEHGTHCWLEDTPQALATRIVSVLRQGPLSGMVEKANNLVTIQHSIPAAASSFQKLVHTAVQRRRQQPYKLLFDLQWMRFGASGGSEQMAHELIRSISLVDRTNKYRMFVPRSTYHDLDLAPGFNCKPFYSDGDEHHHERVVATFSNQLASSLSLPPVLNPAMRTLRCWRKMDFDFVHSMIGYVHTDFVDFPSILTALDLQHIHYPDFFGPDEWLERDQLYRKSAEKAEHIICISENTRQDMHRHYQVPLEKMTTIWLIPSQHAWSAPSGPVMKRLLGGMGIASPFLYFPGHCWPHKNHARLIEAFALIQPNIPKDLQLIFSGRAFPADHPAQKMIKLHGLESRVRHLGYRSAIEARTLLHGCFALVFPSLFEGYGIPVMDAIIAGKPVVCSNCTSLPEIAGTAALMFNPENTHDIAGRLLEIINDPDRREALIKAGRERRPLFSARLSAIKTLAVYQKVHDRLYN
jgi:glycosyltransferase involved in cell wall biosynthesis